MRKRSRPAAGTDPAEASASAATLTRGLEILRAFTAGDATLGNQELIERTGLPKATVSRLTSALLSLGYLHYDETLGRYSIGPATISLGYGALSSSAVVQAARPLMQDLAESTGAAIALGMLDGTEVVYLATCRPLSPVSLRLNVGSRIPVWRTSMGLALMAEMEEDRRERLTARLVAAEPERADRIRRIVDEAVESYRSRGFVSVFGIWYSYINALGAPFRPADGSPVVAITCGGIVDIMPREFCLGTVGPDLVRLIGRLRQRLAGRPETPDKTADNT